MTIRLLYGADIPLSGDEVGVSVLQSVGQWDSYDNSLVCNQPIAVDEIKKFISYSNTFSLRDVITSIRKFKLFPPLYFSILHLNIWLFGNSTIALRGLSATISILSVLSVFLLGKALYNETIGWISACFLSISPYCLEYSIIVRPYPLLTLLSLFSTYLIVVLMKSGGFSYKRNLTYTAYPQ